METTSSGYTMSDLEEFMKENGYTWSNEAQIYYDYDFNHINNKVARKLYESRLEFNRKPKFLDAADLSKLFKE